MYVNKTKVKTLVRKLARLLRQKKKEMWSTLMTPAPAACFIATPTLRSDGLSRRKTVLSGKVEAFSLFRPSLYLSLALLFICVSLYLPSSLYLTALFI